MFYEWLCAEYFTELTIQISFSIYRTLSQSEINEINMQVGALNQLKLCLLLEYICHNSCFQLGSA